MVNKLYQQQLSNTNADASNLLDIPICNKAAAIPLDIMVCICFEAAML
ncbi:MAG: hypothetical protein Q4D71_08200 [Oscillospiraceae bacterium]|nr:hypothetical protein [Oscillospiraceae bacterium]